MLKESNLRYQNHAVSRAILTLIDLADNQFIQYLITDIVTFRRTA